MDTITINGLHKCQPKNEPQQGEIKDMVVLNMPAKNDKKAWIKIKSEKPEKGGSPYRILNVEKLPWEPDQYGNLAFNLEVEATTAQPSAFQQVKAKMSEHPAKEQGEYLHEPDSDWPDAQQGAKNAPEPSPKRSNGDEGLTATRKHLMQSANLQLLCIKAVDKCVAEHLPEIARTSEQFQGLVAQLFIEGSGRRTTDGVHWWSYVDLMPETPIK